jgi:tRNA (guanine26-N2/guanine27-N2)-dimethyltransferase
MKKTQNVVSITEGETEVLVFKKKISMRGPGSKQNVPFYNPSMELNRDLSVLVCQWIINNNKTRTKLLDGLAASGIRGIRFANELYGDFEITINDWNKDSYDLIKKNLENYKLKNTIALNSNLNTLLSENRFHYVDIDPFGSPVYFIDSAMRSIINNGVIACTATDTATLCGVYPNVCIRRYGARSFHTVAMKEVGLRILLGFICREAGKYDMGVDPLICYSTDHYCRLYVRIRVGVNYANYSMKNLIIIQKNEKVALESVDMDIGPLWMGKLQNKSVIKNLRTILFEKQLHSKNVLWKLLDYLEEEADAPAFFYTTDSLGSLLKKSPPKMITIFEILRNKGYDVTRTHFSSTGFKTNAPKDEIEKLFKHIKI